MLSLVTVMHARVLSPANRSRFPQQSNDAQWAHKNSIKINSPVRTSETNHNSGFPGPRYSPTIGKSILDIRKLAKSALLGLLPHSIRYADLLAAGVDETTLRSLYEEIGVKVPPKKSFETVEEHNNNMGQKPSAGRATSNGQSKEDASQHALPVTRPPPPLPSSSPKTVTLQSSEHEHSGPSGKELGLPVVAPLKRQEGVESGAKSSSLPMPNPPTKAIQPTVTTSKPLERKDYIARLLAAKKATAKAPSATVRSSQVPPLAKSSFKDVAKDYIGVSLNASDTKELPSAKLFSNRPKTMDSEAIKEAQTKLARQKMEALKNRNSTQSEQALPLMTEAPAPQVAIPAPALPVTSAPSTSPQAQQLTPPQPSASQSLQQAKRMHKSKPECPVTPTVSQTDNIQPSTTTFTGIPGLFMTSAPLPATHSVALLTSPVPQQSTIANTAINNPRKRPLAADLNDLSTNTLKRPFGQTRQVEIVIDVSDDDIVDMPEDSDMEIEDADGGITSLQSQTVTDNWAMKIGQDPLLWRDNSRRKSVVGVSTVNTPSAPQTPGKGKRPEDLRSREEQIQLMHEKIAELEQRRKSKQSSSRAQTPGSLGVPGATPNSKSTLGDEAKPPLSTEVHFEPPKEQSNAILSPDELKAADVVAAEEERAAERKALEQRVQEQKILDQRASEQKVLDLEAAKIRAQQAELAIAEANAKRRRKVEIETGLPILDAEVQRTQIKLEEMKREISRLEAEVQKGLEGRKSLVEELEGLGVDTEGMPMAQLQAKKDEILELQQTADQKRGESDKFAHPDMCMEQNILAKVLLCLGSYLVLILYHVVSRVDRDEIALATSTTNRSTTAAVCGSRQ